MLDRFMRRLEAATLATMGSKRAQGELNLMNVQASLRNDWATYEGETGARSTIENIDQFLRSRYDMMTEFNYDEFPAHLTQEHREVLWENVAKELLRQGAVSFG